MTADLTGVLVALAAALAACAVLAAAWIRRGPADTFTVAVLRLINDLFMKAFHRLRWTPPVPIPLEGPAIIVANHRSGLDPQALVATTKRAIHFLMAREYYELRGLRWLFRLIGAIPVNRDGNDFEATKAALRILREGGVIGIFPEGGIRLEGSGSAEQLAVRSGAALLALRTGAPIIPARIEGTPNLDSVFGAVLTPSRSRIVFGEPFRLEAPGGKLDRDAIDEAIRRIFERIAGLPRMDGG